MTEENRPNPDALLAELQREELQRKSGKLFIFLGMCPGVGKTYAMLMAARQRMKEGVNPLIGIVETHGREETAALVEGLRVVPRRQLSHRGVMVEEFDLDAVLAEHPALVLVDELAHTNAPGSRHAKRYQDVLELIDAGIDVYTTLNVQHIESQVDIVQQITGVTIQETVPDSLLDRADEIQLIDLSVEKLLERMMEGKVYGGERANAAAQGFFKEGNLTALREMALRFTAEQVDRDLEDIRRSKRVSSAWKTNARLMVGVGPSPYAESLIRWTRRAATRLACPWLVVWVESSAGLTDDQQNQLTQSLSLARKLGGEVISVTGEDVASALLLVARERNVSQLVVGKPAKFHWLKKSLADQLIAGSGEIDVCMVRPVGGTERAKQLKAVPSSGKVFTIQEYGWMLLAVTLMALGCWLVLDYIGYMVVALVFLSGVVLSALCFSRGPVLAMAAMSALTWNFIFIPPQFTFQISKAEDLVMFGMFFFVAVSMGSLTSRLRQREIAENRRLRQTSALLRVTQSAALTVDPDHGLVEAIRTIDELLHANCALIVRQNDRSLPKTAHRASTFQPGLKEWGVITWAYVNRQSAGRYTDTLPQSDATWFPLQTSTAIMGVLGIMMPPGESIGFTTRQTIEALALQLALVLEKEHFIAAVRQAELMSQSEKLHRTLLDSVSHELKTPLAIIRASLEGMSNVDNPYLEEIETASQRLQRVVDSLLHMTRLESEVVLPQRDWCDVNDILHAACEAAGEALRTHPIKINLPSELPLIKLDQVLLAQALANILHNAAVYTPESAAIEISATLDGSRLRITIRDHGSGLAAGEEQRVFEKFYRAPGSPAGGTGLGLAISQGFVRAQGGEISVRNHPDGGAEFLVEMNVERNA